MKIILSVLLAGLFFLPASAQFTNATLQATGLTCAMCSNAVNKSLQKVGFVESVRSDIKNSSFNVVFKAGMPVDIDALKDAVEDAGFSVGSLKLIGTMDGINAKPDSHVKIGDSNFHILNATGTPLSGQQTIWIVDKDYVSAKEFKKLSSLSKMACVNTGKAESCCSNEGMKAGSRVYHITI